jgi:plasmid stabilization system protein ParE
VNRAVRVLRKAQRDLQEIRDYVLREAPARVDAFTEGLLDAMESLGESAERGPRPRDDRLRRQGFRFLVHGGYLIFYKVLRRQVRVYRVLHGKRAYRGLL